MSEKQKIYEIRKLFASSLEKDKIAFIYLEYSGVILRTFKRTIVIDPANLLSEAEINALGEVDLLVFTHSHGDHYTQKEAIDIFKATGLKIIAEPLVTNDLKGKIPAENLTSAIPRGTYTFDDITVCAIQGIHGVPINLYQIKIGEISIFHAGDSGYVPVKNYPSSIAFLPTGLQRPFTPTSSPENAFKMATELQPNIVVAVHGSNDHSKELENKIKEHMPNISVIIPDIFKLNIVEISK